MTKEELNRFNEANNIQNKINNVDLTLRMIGGSDALDYKYFDVIINETRKNSFLFLDEKDKYKFDHSDFSNKTMIRAIKAFLDVLKNELEYKLEKL